MRQRMSQNGCTVLAIKEGVFVMKVLLVNGSPQTKNYEPEFKKKRNRKESGC